MKSLKEQESNNVCIITSIKGDARFISRVTAMGLTPGTQVEIIQNVKRMPLIVYARDTEIALNRKDSKRVLVEEVSR